MYIILLIKGSYLGAFFMLIFHNITTLGRKNTYVTSAN